MWKMSGATSEVRSMDEVPGLFKAVRSRECEGTFYVV